MNESRSSVSAVVVNYNAGDVLSDCVHALLASPSLDSITVVDNASTDNSMDGLVAELGDHARLNFCRNELNVGFARAVNAVAQTDQSEFLLVINPDCILQDSALEQLLDGMLTHERAALAGPLIRDGGGRLEPACMRYFPRPWNSLVTLTGLWRLGKWFPGLRGVRPPAVAEINETITAEATSGACMLLRRSVLADLDFFDEAYALHCEDLDLMYRLRQAGWRCIFVPGAKAIHFQGVSSRTRPYWVHWQKHRGMWRFYQKLLSAEYSAPVSVLVALGIWVHYLLLLPFIWLKK